MQGPTAPLVAFHRTWRRAAPSPAVGIICEKTQRECAHANALPLLGFCFDAPLCLVSPLCRGGNLEDRLFDTPAARARLGMLGFTHDAPVLPWTERLRILRDATRGLVYLHTPAGEGAKPRVLHRDVS